MKPISAKGKTCITSIYTLISDAIRSLLALWPQKNLISTCLMHVSPAGTREDLVDPSVPQYRLLGLQCSEFRVLCSGGYQLAYQLVW